MNELLTWFHWSVLVFLLAVIADYLDEIRNELRKPRERVDNRAIQKAQDQDHL